MASYWESYGWVAKQKALVAWVEGTDEKLFFETCGKGQVFTRYGQEYIGINHRVIGCWFERSELRYEQNNGEDQAWLEE